MRAITVSENDGSPVVSDLPKPEPGPGELAIKVQAAAINPMDRKLVDAALRGSTSGIFPLVPGADMAGEVEAVGDGVTRFSPGDEVFGQLMTSSGTYAEDVVVGEDAPLARVPDGLDPIVAATLPTAGGTGLAVVESLAPLEGKTVLIVGAGGGVGSFATQFAANAGAHVIANTHASAADRMRAYGAVGTIDRFEVSVPDAVRAAHPDGIDVLIDVASDKDAFARLASLVRPGGTALSLVSAADPEALAADGITGVDYAVRVSPELLRGVADALVSGRVVAPPITDIRLDEVPDAWARTDHADGKTVIAM